MPSPSFGQIGTRNGRQLSISRHFLISIVISALLFIQLINGQPNPQQQTCPSANEISPCACQVKKNGLDILCEATDVTHITRAMTALKPRSPIIFYLKLRHNQLPKLQGFIFLALDIRHLTIHNSSLAVIEETSLSSLGVYLPFFLFHLIVGWGATELFEQYEFFRRISLLKRWEVQVLWIKMLLFVWAFFFMPHASSFKLFHFLEMRWRRRRKGVIWRVHEAKRNLIKHPSFLHSLSLLSLAVWKYIKV